MTRSTRTHRFAALGLVCVSIVLGAACAATKQVEGGGTGGVTHLASSASGQGGGGGGSTASSSGAIASSSSGVPGTCVTKADCAAFDGVCTTGNCVNGMCEKAPSNEGSGCDDGVFCTENYACQNGTCVGGTQKFCPSPDSCHVGACDEATKSCGAAPGNDGAWCDDGDPCTYSGTCSNGVCTKGQLVDCSAFSSTCSVGYCDPVLGCTAKPKNDGVPCDDGLFCTVQDVCMAGACQGVPNTCSNPADAACMIVSCNEAQKSCVAVPGPDGVGCDDKNACTKSETCSSGKCVGGVPTNSGGACDDANLCTQASTCDANGTCVGSNPILQCVAGDGCCPAGCDGNTDSDCSPPTNFDVLETKDIVHWGIPYLLLKVGFKSNTSIADNWCFEYQNLCAFYGYVPTGCGQEFTSMNNGYGTCKTKYGSDGVSDSLGCDPSQGVASAANQNGYLDANFKNSFGFQYCDAGTCTKTMCSGDYCNMSLSYIDQTKPYGYTLCKK
jgi:hypothetical protein